MTTSTATFTHSPRYSPPDMVRRYGITWPQITDAFGAILPKAKLYVDPTLIPEAVAPAIGILAGLEELVEDYRRVSECVIEVRLLNGCERDANREGMQLQAYTEMVDGGIKLHFDLMALMRGAYHEHADPRENVGRSYTMAMADNVAEDIILNGYSTIFHEWGHVISHYRVAVDRGHWDVERHKRENTDCSRALPPVGMATFAVALASKTLPSEYAEEHSMEGFAEVFCAHRLGMEADWWDGARRWVREWIAWARETELLVDTTRATVGA